MSGFSIFLIISFLILLVSVLAIALIFRMDAEKERRIKSEKLEQALDRLDEQAKDIVKTDLELNKTQEELDRRLQGLEALQQTSRLITTTLDENEIFDRLHQSFLAHHNYEKVLIFLFDPDRQLQCRLNLGVSFEDVHLIINDLQKDETLMKALQQGHSVSSINTPVPYYKELINRTFSVEHFVLCPILSQNGFMGIFFVGNRSNVQTFSGADEEVCSIISSQIGQTIQNARFFEEAHQARQSLEKKVQDRTIQLERALQEVQDVSKKKTDFVSAVSHELRTPLTSIKGYAEILIAGKLGVLPDAVKTRLEKINLHSDNLVKLINNLLDISRIESGRVEMKFEPTILKNLVANVGDLLTPQMKSKNINWEIHIDDKIPEMMTDHAQSERIFINLVGNAIKFTPERGTISVNARLLNDNKTVECEVADTGIGISPEDMNRLFSEFFRVDNPINQNVKGTGLGLVLAKKIVEAHGGKIWITSQINAGTTFHFTLLIDPTQLKKQSIEIN